MTPPPSIKDIITNVTPGITRQEKLANITYFKRILRTQRKRKSSTTKKP